ncbi:MAG: hypothetical protein ACRYG8_05225, partial [Janthinobacterium lividum]
RLTAVPSSANSAPCSQRPQHVRSPHHRGEQLRYDTLMIIVGMVLLTASLKPLAALTGLLGQISLRRSWHVLGGLILAFIASYGVFAMLQYDQRFCCKLREGVEGYKLVEGLA